MLRLIGIPITDKMIIDKEISNKAAIVKMDIDPRPNYGDRQQGNFQRRPQQRRPYNPNAKYSLKKQIAYKEEHVDPNEPIRLNRYLANAGILLSPWCW